AEAVLFVTDASQELTAAEVEFLRRARQVCPTVACVLTKTDFYPAWRKVRDLNQGHLRRVADGEVPVVPGAFAVGDTAVAGRRGRCARQWRACSPRPTSIRRGGRCATSTRATCGGWPTVRYR